MDGNEAAGRRQALIEAMAGLGAEPPLEEEDTLADARIMARQAWARDRMEAFRRATKAVDDAWMAKLAPYDDLDEDEELPELDPPPEQAVLEAILAEIHAVTEEDRWPRHLHWTV